MKVVLVTLLSIVSTSCAHATISSGPNSSTTLSRASSAEDCREVRAAFDVGSATTRMMVAEVDFCEQKVLRVLKKEERAVPYKDDLERNNSKTFSAQIQSRGQSVFSELGAIAKTSGAVRMAGTATSAFRGATNSKPYLASVLEKTGVSIQVIDQKTEAEVGFLAAVSDPEVDMNAVVVWDIGGGSMQFSALENKVIETSLVELGSVGFKNKVLQAIRPGAPLSDSPNPIGSQNFDKVVALAKAHALEHTTPQMRELLSHRQIIGIGGVHYHSVLKQSGENRVYTTGQIQSALLKRLQFTDAEVGGAYAATDVTNLALVLGYMEALGLESVSALNSNLTNGTIVYPRFW